MGHARALLALDAAEQVMAANEVVARKLSVRDAEKLVARQAAGPRSGPPRSTKKSRDLMRLEERLADKLSASVEIRIRSGGKAGHRGELAIAFGSMDELNGVLERLGVTDN